MKELSLNILDIAQNSVKAGATLVSIDINENKEMLEFSITDNGCGMEEDFLRSVTDPFTTTRTTRKVGLGLPFLKMEAEMTGGRFEISSKSSKNSEDHGTRVYASFIKSSIDYIPLGNITDTVCTLIQGTDNIDFIFSHKTEKSVIYLSTKEMRDMLGGDIPMSCPEVIAWVRDYLNELYNK